jgi:hypothetical protein
MNIREKIFEFVLNRQPERKVSLPHWDSIKSIAILYPEDTIQHIVNQLDNTGKEVVFFSMPDKKDISWWTARPKKDMLNLITAREFDVMIDLSQNPDLTMQYMAIYIKAKFKTGRYIREGILDMTIDTPAQETPDYLYEQVVRYLKMFGG